MQSDIKQVRVAYIEDLTNDEILSLYEGWQLDKQALIKNIETLEKELQNRLIDGGIMGDKLRGVVKSGSAKYTVDHPEEFIKELEEVIGKDSMDGIIIEEAKFNNRKLFSLARRSKKVADLVDKYVVRTTGKGKIEVEAKESYVLSTEDN